MSDLTHIEKIKLERLLEMESGYVLDFYNSTFQKFILDNSNIDIYDEKYDYRSGSKANRLRCFWKKESNLVVGELIEDLLEYWETKKLLAQQVILAEEEKLFNECKKIAKRLKPNNTNNRNQNPPKKEDFSSLRSDLLMEFDSLAGLVTSEDKKKRGFSLENFLERIFSLYKIPTQKSWVF